MNCFPQPVGALARRSAAWQTDAIVTDEIGFAILRYRDTTPVLAACTRCQLKFLTPAQMMKDHAGAAEYLWRKYTDHQCTNAIHRMTAKPVIDGQPAMKKGNKPMS